MYAKNESVDQLRLCSDSTFGPFISLYSLAQHCCTTPEKVLNIMKGVTLHNPKLKKKKLSFFKD